MVQRLYSYQIFLPIQVYLTDYEKEAMQSIYKNLSLGERGEI